MKRLFAFLILCIGSLNCIAQVSQDKIDLSNKFLILLTSEQFEEAAACFDEIVLKQLPPEKLKQVWSSVNTQVGKFKKHTDTHTEQIPNYDIVFLTCEFENAVLDVKLVYTKEGNTITGFFFVPPKPREEQKIPPYVVPDSYFEKEIEIHSGKFILPGTYTCPKDLTAFPVVVLVHGSGPNDRDETIGPNKPFLDLALGLATKGIGTIRYDKRTLVYRDSFQLDNFTLEEETIEDAVAAIEFVKKIELVNNVFLLGHSLGAIAAPRIAELQKDIAGVIMMAGNARPLEDLILEQINYIYSIDGLTEEEQNNIKEMEKQVGRVKSPSLSPQTPMDSLPFHTPAIYWLYLRDYDQVRTARKLKIPILLLQGERDYQVTMQDFNIWEKNLSGKKSVKFVSYPKLNHLFMEGEGKSSPAEYTKQNHIPEYVIRDLAKWILKY